MEIMTDGHLNLPHEFSNKVKPRMGAGSWACLHIT
jgi:hypothetical protein